MQALHIFTHTCTVSPHRATSPLKHYKTHTGYAVDCIQNFKYKIRTTSSKITQFRTLRNKQIQHNQGDNKNVWFALF